MGSNCCLKSRDKEDSELLDKTLFMVRVAELNKNYDQMVDYLKLVVDLKKTPFNEQERNLINVAFKNQISGKRAIIKTIDTIVTHQTKDYEKHFARMNAYKEEKENEI